MVNEYEAYQALENIVNKGHLVLHDLVDDLFVKATEVLANIKGSLPDAAEAGMGKSEPDADPDAEAQKQVIKDAAAGTYMESAITDKLLDNDLIRQQMYNIVSRFPDVWGNRDGK